MGNGPLRSDNLNGNRTISANGAFSGTPSGRKTAALKRPMKRSTNFGFLWPILAKEMPEFFDQTKAGELTCKSFAAHVGPRMGIFEMTPYNSRVRQDNPSPNAGL